ncbi:hypothetical protein X743_16880 [Mesorhizobium sp. LNHC252B00]|nr:hypothetical protein X743_16880 [Mesorhizobium sp. LNHC252B00]
MRWPGAATFPFCVMRMVAVTLAAASRYPAALALVGIRGRFVDLERSLGIFV